MSTDFQDLFAGVKDALGDVLGGARPRRQAADQPSYYEQYFQQVGGGPFGAATPDVTYGAAPGQSPQAWGGGPNFGVTLAPGPFGVGGAADPFGERFGMALGGDPLGGAFGQRQQGAMDQALFAKQGRDQARAAASARSGTATEAGDWSGPATADDNATLDGAKIDQWIASERPNSPLRGKGAYILQTANSHGVSAPLLLGIFLQESELGTTAGPGYNIAGVGGEGNFAQYGSWEQAIDGAAANLGTATYRGKSAAEQVGNWFAGPQKWAQSGLDATDSTGGRNGTVRDYLNKSVAAAYSGLGVPFNQAAGGTRKAGGGTVVSPDGAYFPVAGWTQPVQPHWGRGDATGATDIMAPAGSQIVAVRGGQVTYAAYDPTGGWAVMVQGDDGMQYYYAHMQATPSVQAGQRIGAGAGLGLVGNTGDASGGPAHLHLGIGPQIRQGRDAWGGTGEYADGRQFDAVSYLNRILSSRTSGRGGGTGSRRV
jgi:murein DD-endopeptidase MepM/ murein hydrolase activator NlpD